MVCMVWGTALWMITRRLPIWTQFWRCFIWKNSETHWTPGEVFWPKLSPTMVKAKPKHWKGSKALSWCIAWAPRFNRAARHQDPKHYAKYYVRHDGCCQGTKPGCQQIGQTSQRTWQKFAKLSCFLWPWPCWTLASQNCCREAHSTDNRDG